MIQVKDNDVNVGFKGNGSLIMGSFENFETSANMNYQE